MRRTKEVTLGEATVMVCELTVGEIRNWLKELESNEAPAGERPDVVGSALFESISFADLKQLSDVSDDQLDAATPAEVQTLITAARELNADFFAMRDRLSALGKAALEAAPARSSDRSPR